MEIKSASNILDNNIPDDIAREGYTFGDINEEIILNAMREYAAQFINEFKNNDDLADKIIIKLEENNK